MTAGLHIDARGQHGHDDGFGPAHEFDELRTLHARGRVDYQYLGTARHAPDALRKGRHAADRRQVGGPEREPIETRALRVVIGDTDLAAFTREKYGKIGGESALAAPTFRIQDHDVAHRIRRCYFS
jgi:hypothetical protein